MVHDDLPVLYHCRAGHAQTLGDMGLEAGRSGGWGPDHDRLGPGDEPHDGGGRALGVGGGGGVLRGAAAELLGLVVDDLRDVHRIPGAGARRSWGGAADGEALRPVGDPELRHHRAEQHTGSAAERVERAGAGGIFRHAPMGAVGVVGESQAYPGHRTKLI